MKLAQWHWRSRWAQMEFANLGYVLPRWTPLGLVVMMLLLLAIGWQWQHRQVANANYAQLQTALSAANIKLTPPPAPPRLTQKLKRPSALTMSAEQKALASATQQLGLAWFPLFSAIESAQRADIALLAFTPNAQTARFQLKGEAKHYQALLAYLSTLQSVNGLSEVHLQKHQVMESHPQLPVSFEIEGQWQP